MKLKLPWQTIIIEVCTIVLGVLLALALNQWRENRNNENLARTALANVSQELKANREILQLIHENNRKVLEQIDAGTGEGSFVPGLQLQETAWETMLSTGASTYVDYQTTLVLSDAYAMQKLYKQIGTIMTGAAMNAAALSEAVGAKPESDGKAPGLTAYQRLLVDIETLLMNNYDKARGHLDSRED